MSTGRICPCQRPYKDLANSMNSVGKSLMIPEEGQKQSGKKRVYTNLWHFPHQSTTQVLWSTSLKKCFKYYSLQIKDVKHDELETLYGSNVSSTNDMDCTQTDICLFLSIIIPLIVFVRWFVLFAQLTFVHLASIFIYHYYAFMYAMKIQYLYIISLLLIQCVLKPFTDPLIPCCMTFKRGND